MKASLVDFGAVSGLDATPAWMAAAAWINASQGSEVRALEVPDGEWPLATLIEIRRRCRIEGAGGTFRDYSTTIPLKGNAGIHFWAGVGDMGAGGSRLSGVTFSLVPGETHVGTAVESWQLIEVERVFFANVKRGLHLDGRSKLAPDGDHIGRNTSGSWLYRVTAESCDVAFDLRGNDCNSVVLMGCDAYACRVGFVERETIGSNQYYTRAFHCLERGYDIQSSGSPKISGYDESALPSIIDAPAVVIGDGFYHPHVASTPAGTPAPVVASAKRPAHVQVENAWRPPNGAQAESVFTTIGDAQRQGERALAVQARRDPHALELRANWPGEMKADGSPLERTPWWSWVMGAVESMRTHRPGSSLPAGTLQILAGAFLGPLLSWVSDAGLWFATVGSRVFWHRALSPRDELAEDEDGNLVDGGGVYFLETVAPPNPTHWPVGTVIYSSASMPEHIGWKCCLVPVVMGGVNGEWKYEKRMVAFGRLEYLP